MGSKSAVWPPPMEFPLTPVLPPQLTSKPTLVLDLDETLVHSSYRQRLNIDFILTNCSRKYPKPVYVAKRPHVDEFLTRMSSLYECILFTASLGCYANRVADKLDPNGTIFSGRLFRSSCVNYEGNLVMDLRILGRDLSQVVILDNTPKAYYFHSRNGIPVTTWEDDPKDTELLGLIPTLEDLAKVDNFQKVLPIRRPPRNP